MLSDIKDFIETDFGDHRDDSPEHLELVLNGVVDRFSTKEILDHVVSNGKLLEEVASRSFVHENGFCKIVLLDPADTFYRLRLHLWESDDDDSNIHNHKWNYASFVCQGSIESTLYAECEDGKPHFCYESRQNAESNCRTAQYKKTARLCAISKSDIKTGEIYSQRSVDLHRILPAGSYSATLLLQGAKKNHGVKIYSNNELSDISRPASMSAGSLLNKIGAFGLV